MDHERPFDWPDDFEKMVPEIRRVALEHCSKLRANHTTSNEIVQDIITELWRRRHKTQFTGWPPLREYVLKSVRRSLWKQSWVARRSRTMQVGDAHLLEITTTPVVTGDIGEYLELLTNSQERDAIRMSFVEGLTLKEIAGRLGVSITTASNRVQGGLESLRERLGVRLDQRAPDASRGES